MTPEELKRWAWEVALIAAVIVAAALALPPLAD